MTRDWFTYSAEYLPLANNSSATVRIPIQADSDFELAELCGDCRALVTSETVIAAPAITVQIVDGGVGRILMDRPQLWDNIIGTAERPFILPVPKLFRANGTIQVQVTMANVGAARQVRISLIGFKIFPG